MILSTARTLLAFVLAAFFLLGAYKNGFPAAETLESYRRWGYPPYFHYVTATLELTAAIMLVAPRFRIPGAVLGTFVMIAAIATLILHGASAHILTPAMALGALLALLALSVADRGPSARRS